MLNNSNSFSLGPNKSIFTVSPNSENYVYSNDLQLSNTTGLMTFQLKYQYPSEAHSKVYTKRVFNVPVWSGSITLDPPANEDGNYRVGESVNVTITSSIEVDPDLVFTAVLFNFNSSEDVYQVTEDPSKKTIMGEIRYSEGLTKTITKNITFTAAGTTTLTLHHAFGEAGNHGDPVTITVVEE